MLKKNGVSTNEIQKETGLSTKEIERL